MTKTIIASVIAIAMMAAYCAGSAYAYTELTTDVTITASGIVSPTAAAFSASVVTESDVASTLVYQETTNVANSRRLLKITAKTNVVNNRIIIYTDNDSYFTDKTKDLRATWNTAGTTILKYSGADGGGLIGETAKDIVVSMFWGATDTPNDINGYKPYTFNTTNRSWIVDKWHKMSYAPAVVVSGVTTHPLDTTIMYPAGSATASPLADGTPACTAEGSAPDYPWLYPQTFGQVGAVINANDLYSGPNSTGTVISEALYKNIATLAFNISVGGVIKDVDYTGNYVCTMPRLSTPDPTDSVIAKLMKSTGSTDSYIYLAIGADFTGKPAQTYSTTKLCLALVQN